ncbi:MAG: hypothetical protein H7Z38_08400 [Rubrivivax sp.]|nr:hypothetical protein [Pyrinomonadaceae bacterium]
MRFLYAVRHVERHPATDTKRGRPARWPRELLLKATAELRFILLRETSGRVSVNSFIGQYLPILHFPPDVSQSLCDGSLNLSEAAQLARLTPERLACSPGEARQRRREALQAHLAAQGSQTRLRSRVKEMLGEANNDEITSETMTAVLAKADELLEVDPSDSRHIFWEEMKRIFFAMREIEPQDLEEGVLTNLMSAVDELSNALGRIEKLRAKRQKKAGSFLV